MILDDGRKSTCRIALYAAAEKWNNHKAILKRNGENRRPWGVRPAFSNWAATICLVFGGRFSKRAVCTRPAKKYERRKSACCMLRIGLAYIQSVSKRIAQIFFTKFYSRFRLTLFSSQHFYSYAPFEIHVQCCSKKTDHLNLDLLQSILLPSLHYAQYWVIHQLKAYFSWIQMRYNTLALVAVCAGQRSKQRYHSFWKMHFFNKKICE